MVRQPYLTGYQFGNQRGERGRVPRQQRSLAAGTDEVSTAISALFGAHAQAYRALSSIRGNCDSSCIP